MLQGKRRLTMMELQRCQGFSDDDIPWQLLNVPKTQRGRMIGNAMTQTVLARAIEAVLISARLAVKI